MEPEGRKVGEFRGFGRIGGDKPKELEGEEP